MSRQALSAGISLVPLRQWVQQEELNVDPQTTSSNENKVLGRTVVAFSLTSLMLEMLRRDPGFSTPEKLKKVFTLDNFVVKFSSNGFLNEENTPGWKNISGVDMASPHLSLQFAAPPCLNSSISGVNVGGAQGSFLEAHFTPSNPIKETTVNNNVPHSQQIYCYALGLTLYELFSNGRTFAASFPQRTLAGMDCAELDGPARKKRVIESLLGAECGQESGVADIQEDDNMTPYETLLKIGIPSSICILIENLIDHGSGSENRYTLLKDVIDDLRRSIQDPDRFLFGKLSEAKNGRVGLSFKEEKIYGRGKESNCITEALRRVTSGSTEALLIGGKSGSGKTRLVESLIDQVNAVGGFFVKEKFDLMHCDQYSTVMSAFNALCQTVRRRINPQELKSLGFKLMTEFHSDFMLLAKVIPDIYLICPQLESTRNEFQSSSQTNLRGVSFMLRRFVRIISITTRTVVMFLDDLQWADSGSIEVVQDILVDENVTRFFVIGSYRSEDVEVDHPILSMVFELETHGVPNSILRLDGLTKNHLNEIVSDALCMFPRLCQPISDLIFQNTQGNPFFARLFLHALVNDGHVHYSTLQKRWLWDMDKIISAQMTDDFLCLLVSKLMSLDNEIRSALSTMACFGIKISDTVVRLLSSTPQFSNLQHHLEQAVLNGFLIKENKQYRFIHDILREAARIILPRNERNSHHFKIAFSLHSAFEGEQMDSVLYDICDQFKMAQDYLYRKHSTPIDLVGLFVKAGSRALENGSDFPRARSYFVVAESLLPHDQWETNYSLSLRIYFLRAKSSFCCGLMEESKNDLQRILDEGKCLEDKLDAIFLLATIQFDCNEEEKAFETCCDVLSQLGRPLPHSIDRDEATAKAMHLKETLSKMSESDVLALEAAETNLQWVLKFYSLLAVVLFIAKPQLLPICIGKMVQLSIEKGMSAHSSVALACFALMLCTNTPLADISSAKTIMKLAMCLKERFDLTEQMPMLSMCCSGFVGFYSRSFQECSYKLKIGFDIGYSMGCSFAFFTPYHVIRSDFFAGGNLTDLLKKNDYYLKLVKKSNHCHRIETMELHIDTFRSLISRDGSSGIKNGSSGYQVSTIKLYNFHELIKAFWLRCHERCKYFCNKVVDMAEGEGYGCNIICKNMAVFYRCLNAFQEAKKRKLQGKPSIAKESILTLKELAEWSETNWKNKVFLLEAELFSFDRQNEAANKSYADSISAARKSKFVHEEGLACELAGHHFLGNGENSEALAHFNRAKECYVIWGSRVNADIVQQQISKIQ